MECRRVASHVGDIGEAAQRERVVWRMAKAFLDEGNRAVRTLQPFSFASERLAGVAQFVGDRSRIGVEQLADLRQRYADLLERHDSTQPIEIVVE